MKAARSAALFFTFAYPNRSSIDYQLYGESGSYFDSMNCLCYSRGPSACVLFGGHNYG